MSITNIGLEKMDRDSQFSLGNRADRHKNIRDIISLYHKRDKVKEI